MKKIWLILFCFFFLVFNLAQADVLDDPDEQEDPCKNVKIELANFKSKLILRHDQREYHIEERRIGDKGKLVISESESVEEVYYQNFQRSTRVAFHDKTTNVCKDATLLNEETSNEKRPYKFFHAESGLFGPTALWARIKDRLKEFKYEKLLEDEGTIRSYICKAENLELPNLGKSTIRLQISDPEWQVFGQHGTAQLLKLHLDSSNQFEVKIDYLAFEASHSNVQSPNYEANYDGQSEESTWIIPSVCFNFHMIRPTIKISQKFRMNLEKVDELSGQVLAKYRIVQDRLNRFYSFDKLQDEVTTRVISPKANIFIEIAKGQCIYLDLVKFYDHNKELIGLINRLYELNDSVFDYVGTQLIRSIPTEVYRYNLLSLAESRKLAEGQDFEIPTINVQRSGLGESGYQPVSYRVERFSTANKLKESILYNIYSFEEIQSDDEYTEHLKIDECVIPKTEFSLAAKKDKEIELGEQDEHDLKQRLKKKLESVTGEKPVNFQKIQLKVTSTEIIASATFRDFENPLIYFFVEDDVILDEQPDGFVLTDRQTVEECATASLGFEQSVGFQFCDLESEKYCHVIMPLNLAVLTVRRNDERCKTERKTESDKKIQYETFKQKVQKITTAVKADEFVLNYFGQAFNFNKIHFTRSQLDHEQAQLFELEARERTLTADVTEKTLGVANGVHSLANCFQACRDARESNFTCDHFAYCKRPADHTYDCHLASFIDRSSNAKEPEESAKETAKDETSKETREDLTKEDKNCALYSVSLLNLFVGQPEKRFVKKAVKLVDEIENPEISSTRCAQFCLNYSGDHSADQDRCLSFEICKTDGKATCRLSSTLARWDDRKTVDEEAADCAVYSVNHLLNFYPVGKRPLKNFTTELALSADHCASKCDLSDCDEFNYCETDSGKFCHYVGAVQGPGQNEDGSESELFGCVTYHHRKRLLGPPKLKQIEEEPKPTGNGFKWSSVVGFLLLALFVGLVTGSAALSVKKKWRNKSNTVVSVRFSELSEDQLSDP